MTEPAPHRDSDARRVAAPNCEVVRLEDGTDAVVSVRAIAEGEFFNIGFSDEESDHDHISDDGSNHT